MRDVDTEPLETDERERAALLWDQPTLLGMADNGSRQWRDALALNFVNLGELEEGDPLSLAAHVVLAAMSGGGERLTELRNALSEAGRVAELFESLLSLALDLDDPEGSRDSLNSASRKVASLSDQDLRARLFVRLIAYSELRGLHDSAREAAERAVEHTSANTRLGVAARRWAVRLGIDIPGFSPWAVTDTPEDSLLALPWVQHEVIKASTALEAERFERHLAGMWDSGFHIGRSHFDELAAANFQADWCGDVELRESVRTLLSVEILQYRDSTPEQIRWALLARASLPSAKRLSQAIRERESDLGAAGAAELLRDARRNSEISADASIEIALGTWNVLDDASFEELFGWVLTTSTERAAPIRNNLITLLLWRRPQRWLAEFEQAGPQIRTLMLVPLRPRDLSAAPPEGQELLQAHADQLGDGTISDSLAAALRFLARGTPVESAETISPVDALELLDWNPAAVSQEVVEALVGRLTQAATARLEEAASGSFALESQDTGQLLGRLASYVKNPSPEAAEALILTIQHKASPAPWQFGALEGLFALRRAGRLPDGDIDRIRDLKIQPGPKLLGEQITETVLRASQLRVIAPDVTAADIAWLAVCARESDRRARLVAIVTLGNTRIDQPTTVDWAVTGGLFDPDDEIVENAVASISRRGLTEESGAVPVARHRLLDLASRGATSVRREVVVTAAKRPELNLEEILRIAQSDRAWTVRREIEAATTQESRGEPADSD